MTNPNLKEDLNNYLSRNDKQPITSKLKDKVTNISIGNWISNNVKYSRVPTEDNNTSTSSSTSWFSSNDSENDYCPTLGRFQRITAFCTFIILGLICFGLSALYTPVLLFKARKFAMLFTLGSLFMIFSFSFLWGPINHMKHLFSKERLPFTFCYFVTLILTLYFALIVQSTPLTVLFGVTQIIALIWFLFSYIPGGHTGFKFFTKLCSSSVSSTVSRSLPV